MFKHGRAPGDNIMFTAGVRDFCLLFPEVTVGVDKKYPWIWENNPHIDHEMTVGSEDVEYYRVGYPAVGYANHANTHFTQMFLLDMIAQVDLEHKLPMELGEFCAAFSNGEVGDPRLGSVKKNPDAKEPFISLEERFNGLCKNFARQRGDLHLSEEEMRNSLVANAYGHEKYWIVATGGKSDYTAKFWDWRRFQKVIDYYDGLIKFVTIGSLAVQTFIEPLRGVIDLTGKFDNEKVRGLVPLTYHAEGVISTPSLLMHLGAAVPRKHGKAKAGVAIFGGREPTAWSWYCNYQILHNNGAYSCCSYGGCWKNRTIPLQKVPDKNKSLCKQPVESSGRTIQACMNAITSDDVIRAISRYYEGDLYEYERKKSAPKVETSQTTYLPVVTDRSTPLEREINIIGNLNCRGGGEQSLLKIASVLQDAGWKTNIYPAKHSVHENYLKNGHNIDTEHSLEYANIAEVMKPGLPLLFYANDTTGMFAENAKEIVENSSVVIVGINYVNRPLVDCIWLAKSNKLKAVIFQNTEKKEEWDKEEIGYNGLKKYVMFGAIELDKFLEVVPPERKKKDPMVVLKHCVADSRKYVTEESKGRGKKIHIWQQHFAKDLDTKFYSRLLKSIKEVRFEFMAAPDELVEYFKNEKRMVFHKFDSMDVADFLRRGHVYLYRTSNAWRDNYPRTVAEALAVGLPVLTEPRDGTWERVRHGDTGFHCVHYDEYQLAIKTLMRKEKFRKSMGMKAKEWARERLDPRRWEQVISEIVYDTTSTEC